MTLQINTISEVGQLLEVTGLGLDDIDQLQHLLEVLNATTEEDPEKRKELLAKYKENLATKERQEEREKAHQEQMRNLEHQERMRAYALGQEDPATASTRIQTVGTIAVMTVLAMMGAASFATWILLKNVTLDTYFTILLMVIWGASGVVCLVSAAGSLLLLRSQRPKRLKVEDAPPPKGAREEREVALSMSERD